MSGEGVIGIDVGGGGVRVLWLELGNGRTTVVRCDGRYTRPVDRLSTDLDLEALWREVSLGVRECLDRVGARAEDVRGLAVAAVRFGNVLVNERGEALFAVANRDARAALESFELARRGDAWLERSGMWPLPIHASARIAWLRKHQPDVVARTSALLSVGDWLNLRLCGAVLTDSSQAGCTGFHPLDSSRASTAVDEEAVFEAMPPTAESGEKIGELRASAAEALGLRTGIPIALGGADSQCALLAGGVVSAGEVAAVAGTTAPVMVVCDAPIIDAEGRIWSGHHVIPRRFVLESSGGPMGESLDWFARLLFPDADEPVELVLREAAEADVGSAGLLSTLGAEVMDAKHPHMPFGQFTLGHLASRDDPAPRRHLCRAVLEGLACALRANIEQLASVAEISHARMALLGGLSRGDLFSQIVADVCGREVVTFGESERTALGAAMCAAVGAGAASDLVDACERFAGPRNSWRPRQELAEAHRSLYEAWSTLRDAGRKSTTPIAAAHATTWALRDPDA